MLAKLARAATVGLLAPMLASVAMAQHYTFTDLGTLGGSDSFAYGINNAGQVVGYSYLTGNSAYRATLWDGMTTIDLGTLGGQNSVAYGINNSGRIVGVADTSPLQFDSHAILWDRTATIDLGTLEGEGSSRAFGISDAGQVVGSSDIDPSRTRAVLWNGTTVTELNSQGPKPGYSAFAANAINNSGQIAGGLYHYGPEAADRGAACVSEYERAMVWSGDAMTALLPLAPGGCTQAMDINDAGQVVGASSIFPYAGVGPTHATIWNGAIATELGSLFGSDSFALGINNPGQVVGFSRTADDDRSFRATLWNGTVATDLNTYLDRSFVDAGWYLYSGRAINDRGWITGEARNNMTGETHAYMLSVAAPVPEPGTYAMMLAGLLVVGLGVKGRKGS